MPELSDICAACGQSYGSHLHGHNNCPNVNRPTEFLETTFVSRADQSRPLVSRKRQAQIREFINSLHILEEAFGLRLSSDDGSIEVLDTRNPLPTGYAFAAIIRNDGVLEIAEWIKEDEPEVKA